jgi:VCBS repeat-containing protein
MDNRHHRSLVAALVVALLSTLLPAVAVGGSSEPAGAPFSFSWQAPTRSSAAGVNLAAAGAVRSVKFSLGGNEGLNVLAPNYPKSQQYNCATGAPLAGTQSATAAFGTPLTYNATTGVYTYSWQTFESWSDTCRRFKLKLSDGSVHKAKFDIAAFHISSPLQAYPGLNDADAGTVVPVRFQLGGASSSDIFRGVTPRSARIDCATGAFLSGRTRTLPHGSAGLTRDPSTHEFTYAWQTRSIWLGTCRRFEMRLRDGSIEGLSFDFHAGAPHAVADGGSGFSTDEATAFTTPNVLANDSDPDGDSFGVTGMSTAGTVGSVTNNGDGTFGYNPNGMFESVAPGASATDTFSYTITDATGATASATVSITINGLNDAPTDIGLSSSSVLEGQASGTPVGDFSTTDGDSGDTFTYTFATGGGDTGNGSFSIVGNQLRTGEVFDYETKSSYSIRIRSTDFGGLFIERAFTIDIEYENHAPVNTVPGSGPSGVAETDIPVPGLGVVDDDAGSDYVQVTLSVLHGAIRVSTTDGLEVDNVFDNNTATVVISARLDQINATFTAANGVIYRSNVGDAVSSDTLTFNTNDLGHNGAGGAKSDEETLTITLSPAAPVLDNQPPVNTVPAGPISTTTQTDTPIAGLSISDPDADYVADYVHVTFSVLHGTLFFSGGVSGGVDSDDIGGNGSPSVLINSPIGRINTTLAATNGGTPVGLTYRSDDGFVTTVLDTETLTVFTEDLGHNGSGPAEHDTDSVPIDVSGAPIANDDLDPAYTTVARNAGATDIPVLDNDVDPDGGPAMQIVDATQPLNGTVVLTGGTLGHHTGLTYQPNTNYCNTGAGGAPPVTPDTFTYTLDGMDTATVSMTVSCP